MIYADDHNGQLAYNLGSSDRNPVAMPSVTGPQMAENWVNNVLNWEINDTDNTNVSTLIGSGLGPYASKSGGHLSLPFR